MHLNLVSSQRICVIHASSYIGIFKILFIIFIELVEYNVFDFSNLKKLCINALFYFIWKTDLQRR